VHAAEDDEKKLMSGEGARYPPFLRGDDITTGFHNVTQREREGHFGVELALVSN
jgi:hypothetical protein